MCPQTPVTYINVPEANLLSKNQTPYKMSLACLSLKASTTAVSAKGSRSTTCNEVTGMTQPLKQVLSKTPQTQQIHFQGSKEKVTSDKNMNAVMLITVLFYSSKKKTADKLYVQ